MRRPDGPLARVARTVGNLVTLYDFQIGRDNFDTSLSEIVPPVGRRYAQVCADLRLALLLMCVLYQDSICRTRPPHMNLECDLCRLGTRPNTCMKYHDKVRSLTDKYVPPPVTTPESWDDVRNRDSFYNNMPDHDFSSSPAGVGGISLLQSEFGSYHKPPSRCRIHLESKAALSSEFSVFVVEPEVWRRKCSAQKEVEAWVIA